MVMLRRPASGPKSFTARSYDKITGNRPQDQDPLIPVGEDPYARCFGTSVSCETCASKKVQANDQVPPMALPEAGASGADLVHERRCNKSVLATGEAQMHLVVIRHGTHHCCLKTHPLSDASLTTRPYLPLLEPKTRGLTNHFLSPLDGLVKPTTLCHSHLFAMSGRKLGGGRILGNGKGLAPPAPPSAQQRATSPFAPSESTLSITSSSISPPVSSPPAIIDVPAQDLASNISLGASKPAASGSKLSCPICEEEMVRLYSQDEETDADDVLLDDAFAIESVRQPRTYHPWITTNPALARHIDDAHQELPEVEQDEVRTWFDKQVTKAKKFQPLSLINQKLRGLDVFESNESVPLPAPSSSSRAIVEEPIDPDDLITHSHWQRQTMNDRCTDPLCGKNLGAVNGSINCRKCGRLFCEEHTMYQMKLSRSAHHEPVRGYWARVCETCFKSRDGYNDHHGVLNDYTKAFADIRRKRVERQNLEISRLEKRLTTLTKLLANPPEERAPNGRPLSVASFAGQKGQRKLLEQSVIAWEDDATVPKCPFCQQEFAWTFRRHHCRICGRVVCADPQTACSSDVGLNIASCKPSLFCFEWLLNES